MEDEKKMQSDADGINTGKPPCDANARSEQSDPRVTKLESEKMVLAQRILSLENEAQKREEAIARMKIDLGRELESRQRELLAMQNTISNLKEEFARDREGLESSKAAWQQQSEEMRRRLEKERADWTDKLKRQTEIADALRSEMILQEAQLKAQLEAKTREIETEQERQVQEKQTWVAWEDERRNWQIRIEEFERETLRLKEEISRLEGENLEKENRLLQGQTVLDQEIKNLREIQKISADRREELEREFEAKNNELKQNQLKAYQEVDRLRQEFEEEKTQLEEKNRSSTGVAETWRNEVEKLKEQLEKNRAGLPTILAAESGVEITTEAEFQAKLREKEKEILNLRKQLEEEHAHLTEETAVLRKVEEDWKQARAEWLEKFTDKEREMEKLRREMLERRSGLDQETERRIRQAEWDKAELERFLKDIQNRTELDIKKWQALLNEKDEQIRQLETGLKGRQAELELRFVEEEKRLGELEKQWANRYKELQFRLQQSESERADFERKWQAERLRTEEYSGQAALARIAQRQAEVHFSSVLQSLDQIREVERRWQIERDRAWEQTVRNKEEEVEIFRLQSEVEFAKLRSEIGKRDMEITGLKRVVAENHAESKRLQSEQAERVRLSGQMEDIRNDLEQRMIAFSEELHRIQSERMAEQERRTQDNVELEQQIFALRKKLSESLSKQDLLEKELEQKDLELQARIAMYKSQMKSSGFLRKLFGR